MNSMIVSVMVLLWVFMVRVATSTGRFRIMARSLLSLDWHDGVKVSVAPVVVPVVAGATIVISGSASGKHSRSLVPDAASHAGSIP